MLISAPLQGDDDIDSKKLDKLKQNAPTVFLDCRRCDKDYIRTEIVFVNYVRERRGADVHVLVTEQRTGSGGREYTMEFIGQEKYSDIHHTMKYVSHRTYTWDESREGMVEVLKRGLFPYIMHSPIAEHISILFKQKVIPTAVKDKWDFWVFSLGFNGRLGGEKQRNYNSIRGNFSANRVTPDLKIRMGVSGNFDESNFDIDGESIKSTSERKNFSGMMVKSLGDHWSIGGWLGAVSSTYNNKKAEIYIAPALEYNIFPYAESTRKQLRFLYRIGYNHSWYEEETIYEKLSEDLLGQSLSVTLEIREPWGNASTYMVGSHYFHDLEKNRFEFGGHVSVRLLKGLNWNVRGEYSRIHDQLSLSKGEASLDEILLRRKELATDYDYSVSMGLSYTFGSVFSNVVNPRFGR
jgi:hypothetical protein